MLLPAPPFKFLFQHPAHLLACGFGSGLSGLAPGTAGTAFAWVTYGMLRGQMPSDLVFVLFLVLAFGIGISVCQITGRNLGVIDHGAIVWDEIVPFWAVLLFTPTSFWWQLAAFLVFRFFDVVKPQPARYFDIHVKNGFGVMMDDAIAASYTILTLAVAKALLTALGY
ncbi:MAG: phosphatidylglycerophosphatase A [Rugosibacter sp.]|jgi:phosphatidylglycerophosphatase A|nr:phosphatidylglycerophosphatase A [Rugosibacter sp.]MDO9273724.1 phosphatidylglycerophosphatase A [Rugosibacter sp.]